ncbi:hypothetical protein GCM10025868_44190 [Angustibacter aerolatus]|uniref:Helicase C-terminal domain-containing protein n=1 Tax=Angustibacter aerolatus TaxID=1162965 RepID=A0ABQ6JPB2_9ACTN|nr:hypothetical protein GCM10025868_44190 [Angustibacter aerolatus]
MRHGIGVHHAGMLPRYRRLVERLAQSGLLKVVCGTDTLGVGINVPIRTVLLVGLTKYDGRRVRRLNAREFHQISGRAGRAGFDTSGTVVVQAPEHVIEDHRAVLKAGDDPKKRRKVVRHKPPEGFVGWSQQTFENLVAAEPEPLQSRMMVSHAMLLNTISRPGDTLEHLRHLLRENQERPAAQVRLVRRAVQALPRACSPPAWSSRLAEPDETGRRARLTVDLRADFALDRPLSAFALAVLDVLDRDAPTYPLDVVSVLEATLDDPMPVLMAQRNRARGEAVEQMKADGLEYEERVEPGRRDRLAATARRPAGRHLRDLPGGPAVARRHAAVAQVGGARHGRARPHVHRDGVALRAAAVGGAAAALPVRRRPRAAPHGARRRPHRRASTT